PRAIVADGEVVGFLMLEIDPDEEDGRPFWLWRFMVGAEHQRLGYGRAAMALAIDEVRRRGATQLWTSWVPGDDGPDGFYRRLGFEPTGEVDDGELVAVLAV
ncbi:MAG: GNAT family N-acetyltransferase, partial [Acidimicrobiia bacterium]